MNDLELLASFRAEVPGPEVSAHDERQFLSAIGSASGPVGLRGRARPATRRRWRVGLAAGAVGAAAAATAGTLLVGSVASAPSAFAAVNAAVKLTFSDSYHVSVVTTKFHSMTVTGDFDPARHAGQLAVGTSQIRYVGGHVYVYDDLGVYRAQDLTNTGNNFTIHPCGTAGALCGDHWAEEGPAEGTWVAGPGNVYTFKTGQGRGPVATYYAAGLSPEAAALYQLSGELDGTGLKPDSPEGLLALLRTATAIRADGTASGAGWTGTRYSFSVVAGKQELLSADPNEMITAVTGTIDVDQQGRVRHLHVIQHVVDPRIPSITNDMTFSDFGQRVPVTAPPASQVTKEPQFAW
jgi:hypothetical protein